MVGSAENPFEKLDSYDLNHLISHLEAAGIIDEIHKILLQASRGNNAWYEIKEQAGYIDSFLSDVEIAQKLAKEKNFNYLSPNCLGLQLRYALIMVSVESRFKSISPEVLFKLVQDKVWSIEKALGVCQQFPSEAERTKGFLHLSSLLSENFLIEKWYEIKKNYTSTEHYTLIPAIASQLIELGKVNLASELINLIAKKELNANKRDAFYFELVPKLIERSNYDLVIVTIELIKNDSLKSQAIVKAEPRFPEIMLDKLIVQAFQIADDKALELAIEPLVARFIQLREYEQALGLAFRLKGFKRLNLLLTLAPYFHEEFVFREFVSTFPTIQNSFWRFILNIAFYLFTNDLRIKQFLLQQMSEAFQGEVEKNPIVLELIPYFPKGILEAIAPALLDITSIIEVKALNPYNSTLSDLSEKQVLVPNKHLQMWSEYWQRLPNSYIYKLESQLLELKETFGLFGFSFNLSLNPLLNEIQNFTNEHSSNGKIPQINEQIKNNELCLLLRLNDQLEEKHVSQYLNNYCVSTVNDVHLFSKTISTVRHMLKGADRAKLLISLTPFLSTKSSFFELIAASLGWEKQGWYSYRQQDIEQYDNIPNFSSKPSEIIKQNHEISLNELENIQHIGDSHKIVELLIILSTQISAFTIPLKLIQNVLSDIQTVEKENEKVDIIALMIDELPTSDLVMAIKTVKVDNQTKIFELVNEATKRAKASQKDEALLGYLAPDFPDLILDNAVSFAFDSENKPRINSLILNLSMDQITDLLERLHHFKSLPFYLLEIASKTNKEIKLKIISGVALYFGGRFRMRLNHLLFLLKLYFHRSRQLSVRAVSFGFAKTKEGLLLGVRIIFTAMVLFIRVSKYLTNIIFKLFRGLFEIVLLLPKLVLAYLDLIREEGVAFIPKMFVFFLIPIIAGLVIGFLFIIIRVWQGLVKAARNFGEIGMIWRARPKQVAEEVHSEITIVETTKNSPPYTLADLQTELQRNNRKDSKLYRVVEGFTLSSEPNLTEAWLGNRSNLGILDNLAKDSRVSLLNDIQILIPYIKAVGGEDALKELCKSISDVGQWWE